jgi:hypothetical protein
MDIKKAVYDKAKLKHSISNILPADTMQALLKLQLKKRNHIYPLAYINACDIFLHFL